MPTTILYDDRETLLENATAKADELWLPLDELEAATGWHSAPEGMCRGEACVPVPKGAKWLDERGGKLDLAGFARHLDQPVVHDEAAWAFGDPPAARRAVIDTLEAPDFALPDLDGRVHRLSDYRGKKVFLFSWGTY
jgi:hypothetical protein